MSDKVEDMVIKPRLAFAGLGNVGLQWLKAIVDSGYADILQLYDQQGSSLEEASHLYGRAAICPSLNEIFNDDKIDGVLIPYAGNQSKDVVIKCLENNKAVFCLSPIARRSKEAEKIIDCARKSNQLLGIDFKYRYVAAFQMISHIIRSGEMGKIHAIDLNYNATVANKTKSVNGCILDFGLHMIDLMLYALDFPEVTKVKSQLFSNGEKLKNSAEDFAHVVMELKNNSFATLTCSTNQHIGQHAIIEATFFGERGGLRFKNISGSLSEFHALRFTGSKSEILAGPPDDWENRALIRWIRNLGANSGYNKEAECYLPSSKVIDMIYGL